MRRSFDCFYRLDVNYGGSSGYGRKYIERLNGNWGIVDVQDSIFAPQALCAPPYDLVDPKRLIIRGGSAGGFTVLACLTIASDVSVFAAATSLYGVSDLNKLAEFTHKFESRYLDHLMGGTPEQVPEVYKGRSPINHAANIVVPLLVSDDMIHLPIPGLLTECVVRPWNRSFKVKLIWLYLRTNRKQYTRAFETAEAWSSTSCTPEKVMGSARKRT